jgi:UDP-N-acetylmuramoyl-L-alanyl-D-glutamate--2,6-diaminopimelate ligase
VDYRIGDRVAEAVRTTPEASDLQSLLKQMVDAGCRRAVLEVSSHALALKRVHGLSFEVAVFTNLSRDHLDFHGDMDTYFAAKAELFTPARATSGVVCIDDDWGRGLVAGARIPLTTYALSGPADWTADSLARGPQGTTTFLAHGPNGSIPAGVGLPGSFNVANALAALAVAVRVGVDPQVAARAITDAPGVPGRMERVTAGQRFLAFVDYAHTPDAVGRVVATAREITSGRVIVVLGCGGDRDREKRPDMGQVAAAAADVLVVTDDNPRSEEPSSIRGAIMEGARRVGPQSRAALHEEGDRHAAIGYAAGAAAPGDCVLVLGKGHEQGQEAAGVITPFDDRVVLREVMEALS